MKANERSRFKEADFTFDRPVDHTDPGFAIKGCKLRWVSGHVESRRGGRIWHVLKKSDLPKKCLDEITDRNPFWSSEGDTIRRRDLVLAYARQEDIDYVKRENRENQNANESVLRGKRSMQNEIKSSGEQTLERAEGSGSDQFN